MPLSFPLSPALGQIYTYNTNSWRWDGERWKPVVFGGATGATGATGPAGDPGGATGATGQAGNPGSPGTPGGATGATGTGGPSGPIGATGPRGATGLQGSPGGATGTTGATGATGIGVPGDVGATGATGPAGLVGLDGIDGATGATGPVGATGAPGVNLASATESFTRVFQGTGSQLSFNLQATVANTSQLVTFVDGIYQVPETNFTANTGWITFVSAPSANSEIVVQSVANTFGTTGATGATGPQGDPGGATGVPGATGSTGPTGSPGSAGAQGSTGATGPSGSGGAQGSTGATGPTGSPGSAGAVGSTGATGTVGPVGATGIPGTPGAPGTGVGEYFAGSSAPTTSNVGARWFDTINAIELVYVSTPSSNVWVEMGTSNVISAFNPLSSITVNYLVVAGGGGGGSGARSAGGGAGGFRSGNSLINTGSTYPVVVGAGGGVGTPGSDSSFLTITGAGGGRGGGQGQTGLAGGSGGGGGYTVGPSPLAGGAGNTPSVSPSQGNSGGPGGIQGTSPSGGSGGGGGAGASGNGSYSYGGGEGGIGLANPIFGSTAGELSGGIYYLAGGGTGSRGGGGGGGSGGLGGGGYSLLSQTNGGNGTINTGGGAGGAPDNYGTGGTGGSGIVIVSYSGAQLATGGIVTSTANSTIHTFTTSGNLTINAATLVDFPASPTDQQTYTYSNITWVWNTRYWKILPNLGGAGGAANITVRDEGNLLVSAVTSLDFVGSAVTTTAVGSNVVITINGTGGTGYTLTYSNVAPTNPSIGDRWINSEDLIELVYINDGDNSFWLETASGSAGAIGATGPAGAGEFYTASSAPATTTVGARWFDTINATELIYVSTTTSNVWVEMGTSNITAAFNPVSSLTVDYLVVAGGGGGGASQKSGGGGGGGFRTGNSTINAGTTYSVVVGAGGSAGSAGSNSSFLTLTSAGGGRGGAQGQTGGAGGSGGGGGFSSNPSFLAGGAGNTPAVTPSQGNSGGQGGISGNPSNDGSGGGGGAGGSGSLGSQNGGNGGIGRANPIPGSTAGQLSGGIYYLAGGGGGAPGQGAGTGAGGLGGGGSSPWFSATNPGTVNTGGGGAGGGRDGGTGGTGGSGVVVVSYAGSQRATGGTVTSSNNITIHTFTSSGNLIINAATLVDFPANPTDQQTYSYSNITWVWNTRYWKISPNYSIGPTGATGATGLAGPTGATGLAGPTGATGPAGSPPNITVSNQGTLLTNSLSSINFTGAGVTANTTGSNVTVAISGNATAIIGGNPGDIVYQAPVYQTITGFTIANNPTNGVRDSDLTFNTNTADFTVKFEVLGTRPSNPGFLGIGILNVGTNTRTNAIEWADYAAYDDPLARKLINYAYTVWQNSTPFRLQVTKTGTTLTWTFRNTSDVVQLTDTSTITAGQTYRLYFYYNRDSTNDSKAIGILTDTAMLFTSNPTLIGYQTGFITAGSANTVLIGQGINSSPVFSSNLTVTNITATNFFNANGLSIIGANLLSVSSNIVPASNSVYDIGSSSLRWRDLYLSGNTIDLGGTAIKSTANVVSFTNAANSSSMVGLSVGSIKLNTNGNIITLQAGANGLLTVDASGVIAPITAGGGATVIVSGTKPVVGGEGNLWLNSETGDLNVYFGNAWAIVGGGGGGSSGGGTATVTAISGQQNTATDFISIPAGTTAQRPANPVSGYIRYNTTLGYIEWYDGVGAAWRPIYQSHSFSLDYLVVAGGGGGGSQVGGGGGAGGLLTGTQNNIQLNATYTVTIGAGGTGGSVASSTDVTATSKGVSGTNSVFNNITATGGGGGGSYGGASSSLADGLAGGSGGGGGAWNSGNGAGGAASPAGQGSSGGSGVSSNWSGGGGGGAGATGSNGGSSVGGAGGAGANVSITGTSVTYAGGGGGCGSTSGGGGAGGIGGGGRGGSGTSATTPYVAPVNGTVNTGGGGGGNRDAPIDGTQNNTIRGGGSGGSGVIILRIPSAYTATFSAGLTTTANTTAVVGSRIYSVTAGTGTVTFSLT